MEKSTMASSFYYNLYFLLNIISKPKNKQILITNWIGQTMLHACIQYVESKLFV